LAHAGHATLAASDAGEALAIVKTAMPDAVVLEIRLPGMDGIELIGRLIGRNPRLPVVIYTGDDSYRNNFIAWVADAYLLKCSDLSELTDTLRQVLAKRRTPVPVASRRPERPASYASAR